MCENGQLTDTLHVHQHNFLVVATQCCCCQSTSQLVIGGLNGATVQAREQVELDEAVFWRVGDAVGLVIGAGDYGYQVGGCA
jgi:hypothetical protein